MDTVAQDWRSFQGFSDTYSAAAHDILATLDAASTTSTTITGHAKDLNALLLSTAGFAQAGIRLLGPNGHNVIHDINALEPTTDLLMKYNPEYTCMLVGAKYYLDHGGYDNFAGINGRSLIVDAGLHFGEDPYKYPDNLPIVAAKGGPGGKPGCGSLPYVAKDFPVRYEVTNTGWGTGLDLRPNPGIGHPWWIDFFPVTRGVPEPPSIRPGPGPVGPSGLGEPAPGPVPYPGAPPYGAPLYGPGGTPLYPGVPAPPQPEPPPPGPAPQPEPLSSSRGEQP
jgi:phospholipid/cholesterol/gamma-HCH transport system substrate-binding protein